MKVLKIIARVFLFLIFLLKQFGFQAFVDAWKEATSHTRTK